MPLPADNRCQTLVELLRSRAEQAPDRQAYVFLDREGAERERLTYAELDRRARAIAVAIGSAARPGDRALILHPPSLEYVAAFFGCLYAGVVAVTAYPPNFSRHLQRLQSLVADAEPAVAVTNARIARNARNHFERAVNLADVRWLDTATVDADGADWQPPRLTADSLAFLQYTSGTTGSPRGVMVSHGNLLHNAAVTADRLGYGDEPRMVSWLPPYHDMGLIGSILQPLYGAFDAILMAPATFAVDPVRWLDAMSRYRGTASFAPNFAFELCVDRIAAAQRAELDLSAWSVAGVGAEPTRPETLDRFTAAFGPQGFHPRAWRPAYGLAEATLAVSICAPGKLTLREYSADGLEHRRVSEPAGPGDRRRLVACGSNVDSAQRVLVVDPDTRVPCSDRGVGEIWLAGPSVAGGYWRREADTERAFGARLADGDGPYLRTGDLGFLDGDQLFVSGRIKDMLIIRGRNLYPQDVEACAGAAHPVVRPALCAATAIEVDGEERLLVVAEVERHRSDANATEVAAAVRAAVARDLDVEVHALVLVAAGTMPRTSSGKIQRHACRREFLDGSLTEVGRWTRTAAEPTAPDPSAASPRGMAGPTTRRPLREMLLALDPALRRPVLAADLSRRLAGLPGADLTAATGGATLAALGLDSLRACELQHGLEHDLGIRLPLVDLLDNSVDDIVGALTGQFTADRSAADQPPEPPVVVADPEHRHDLFPLTDLQQAYLIGRTGAYQLGGVSTYFYSEYDGVGLDVARLITALRSVVDRHPMLHATIDPDGTQRVRPEPPTVEVPVHDLRDADGPAVTRHLDAVRDAMSHQVLPLDRPPLLDVRITRLPADRTRVHIGFDLLVGDVRSLQILFSEWEAAYRRPDAVAAPIGVTFRDYQRAARRLDSGPGYEAARAYWLDRIDTLPAGPQLPLAPNAATVRTSRFRRFADRLDAASWRALTRRAAAYGVTPSAVLLAAYATVLARWSAQPRFCLTVTLFNRLPLHPDVDRVIGDFTTVSLLETDLTDAPGIATLARRLQRQMLQDMEHRRFSGVSVLRELARRRGGTGSVTAPVVFTSARDQGEVRTDWLGEPAYAVSQTPQVWLDHQVYERDGEQWLSWDAVVELFPDGLIEDMFDAYRGLLRRLAADRDVQRAWSGPQPLVPGGQLDVVDRANATTGPVPQGLLHGPLVARAGTDPARTAVIAADGVLDFSELYRRACATAWRLRRAGVQPGDLVAVAVEKSAAQVVAVVGVLLADAAYVPVDPRLPAPRQRHLLSHSNARAVICAKHNLDDAWPPGVPVIAIDPTEPESGIPDGAPPSTRTPSDIAYVIYTSGSTGTPKGVAVSHRAALNTCVDVTGRYGIGPDDRVLGLSSLSFDLSVWDIFGVPGAGGALVLPEPGASRDPGRWYDLVSENRITVWNSVPALAAMFVEHLEGQPFGPVPLRRVLLSGDWIPLDLPDRIRAIAPGAEVISLGGATEAAIWSIAYPVGAVEPHWESIPYGRPLTNQRFHVLDGRLRPCPVWVVGELYIGGTGLATGYWNDPERTDAAFITHPDTGERLYRTGDLGRWLPDGVIEFRGRTDLQVKIGGHRVELGEIEHVLAAHPGVADAVAVATGPDRHRRRLAGYVVRGPDRAATPAADAELAADVRAYAARHLPHYMVPPTVAVLDRLPLNANGKVDRGRLPKPEATDTGDGYAAPAHPMEHIVVGELRQLIDLPRISVTANFFDLGLDSILILRLHRRLRAALGRDFPLTVLFEHPNVQRVAGCLAAGAGTADAGGRDAAVDAAYAHGAKRRHAQRRQPPRVPEQETSA